MPVAADRTTAHDGLPSELSAIAGCPVSTPGRAEVSRAEVS
jgi:hypothetical protein